MVVYVRKAGKIVEVTCCHAQIPLINLVRSNGKMTAELWGGAPNKVLTIDKKDVRSNRSGWRSMVKALGSNVTSALKYDVKKLTNTITLKDLATLPERVIVPVLALPYLKCYREFFAYMSIMTGELDC